MMVMGVDVTVQVIPELQRRMRTGIWQLLPKEKTEHSIRPVSSALFRYQYDSFKADRVQTLRAHWSICSSHGTPWQFNWRSFWCYEDLTKVRERFYWNSVRSDAEKCCGTCDLCAVRKGPENAQEEDCSCIMSSVHETTGYTPIPDVFERDLRLPADLLFSWPLDAPLAPEEYIRETQAWIEKCIIWLGERIGMASEKMKTRHDAKQLDTTSTKATKCGLWNRNVAKDSLKAVDQLGRSLHSLKRQNDLLVWIQKSPLKTEGNTLQ
ncbi:integrase_H2C2 domain-containing protein [Trichonephila clavipes]|nr:integrase_H2C2 domain-containing protein [Trichonephila clavipes]